MANAAGRKANFLLNVGPMPSGTIQPEFVDTLKAVGAWMKVNGETIYGTRGNIIAPQEWGVVTSKQHTYYVHIMKPVDAPYLFLPGIKNKILSAASFSGKTKLKIKQVPEGVFVYLEGLATNAIDTIIELTF
jgi:alpha-L-fucosidase